MDKPTLLPANDPDASGRAGRIAKAREAYRYDFSTSGILFAAEVPKSDSLDARYIAKVAELGALLKANEATGRGKSMADVAKVGLGEKIGKVDNEGRSTAEGRPTSLDDYRNAIALLPKPRCLDVWQDDFAFAWQRVAGENAHMLKQVQKLPENFPVKEEHFQRALGTRAVGDSLQAAISEGRAFLANYERLDGISHSITGGVQHFMYAPLGLFCVEKSAARRLMPIAIQCQQRNGRSAPIFTPGQGRHWTLAKQCFQTADMTIHGQVYHFGYCHALMEAMILSSRRTLADNHPLLVLLVPHFEYTLSANDAAKAGLAMPGGYVDRLLGASLDAENELMLEATQAIHWSDLVPSKEFQEAGTGDKETLPEYPWRDDGLLSWPVILKFVTSYVRIYYASDAAVSGDTELKAWLTEIGAEDGARLPKFIKPSDIETVDALATLIAGIIYRCSVYHAAINYSGFDWQVFAPNKFGSGFAIAPTHSTVNNDDALRAMLPPLDLVYLAATLLTQQREIKLNRLLYYPKGYFTDARVGALVDTAQSELASVDSVIEQRNLSRLITYPYASPSQVPNSIMV